MDLGIRQAGFDVLAQVELDPHCCATLRANADGMGSASKVVEQDIRTVVPRELLRELRLKKEELDLLFGGPPCQSFSLAGKQRGLQDERGLLLFEVVRFTAEIRPKVVFLEQVKGLLSSRGGANRRGEVFERLLKEFEAIDYTPKWRIVLAADYGLPQIRERLFIVATRGQNGFEFPQPTHTPPRECAGLFRSRPYICSGEVLKGLGKPAPKVRGKTTYDRRDSHVDVTPLRDRERIAQVPEGSYLAAQTHLSSELRRGLTPKDTTKYLRLHRKRPSNTLRCGEIFYHPTEDRYLTPREYMRLHGYPDDYVLMGPIRSRTGSVRNLDQHRQVANSVPPPLAEVLGLRIRRFLDEQDL